MSTSGSTDFSVNCLEIIKASMRQIGVLGVGQTPTTTEVIDCREALNMLVKQWMGLPHTMKMWLRKELTITLVDSTSDYTLKIRRLSFTSGGATAIAVGDTITGATGGATAKVCCVTLSSGTWAGSDAAGELLIYDQVGTFQAEELNTNLATIAANSDQYGPFTEIVEGVLRNSDGQDSPMRPMTEAEYMAIGGKVSEGTPRKYFMIKGIDKVVVKFDMAPSDTTDTVVLVVRRPIENFDANTDDIDMPREWYRPIKYNLAIDIAPEFEVVVSKELAFLAANSLEAVLNFEPEYSDMYFQPGKD